MEKIHRIAYGLACIMLFLLPFHAFGTVVLNFGVGLGELLGYPQAVNAWKEITLLVLTLLLFGQWFIEYKNMIRTFASNQNARDTRGEIFRKILTFDVLDGLIGAYLLFGVLHFILLKNGVFGDMPNPLSLSQFFLGVKYDDTFLYAFLLAKHLRFSKKEVFGMIKAVLAGGILSVGAAYLLSFGVKPENLVVLGFRNDWSTWLPHQALAFCQKIEHQNICRMSGTFAGPNQMGAYLTLLFPLLVFAYQRREDFLASTRWKSLRFLYSRPAILAVFLFSLGALMLTLSRGAFIGTLAGLLSLAFLQTDARKYFWKVGIPLSIVMAMAVGFAFAFDLKFITRPASTFGHIQAWNLGITEMINHPFGQGIGSSGPASSYTNHPIIPESWYFQVGVETGFLGLILFLLAQSGIALRLWRKREHYLLAGFLGVSVIAFFLHTFEDAPTSLTLYLLAGAALGELDTEEYSGTANVPV